MSHPHRRLVVALFVACSWLPGRALAAPSAQVSDFSPQGLVKAPRQVRATFSEPMIRLGDPRAPLPFVVTCPEPGTSRWLDSRTWAYDFSRELPGGLRCSFALTPELRSLAGAPIAPATFTFDTGGPAILWHQPRWEDLEEEPIVVLALDAEVDTTSLLEHTYFAADGVGERIGVSLVEGDERAAVLATLNDDERQASPLVLIRPRQALPPGAKVRLVWGAGIRTPDGVATAVDHVTEFSVRQPFVATFTCTRERTDAACNPLRPMALDFSDTIDWDLAQRIELRGPEGKTWHPAQSSYASSSVSGVSFRGPFPEQTSLEVVLPADLADQSGRKLTNADRFPLQTQTAAYPPLAKFAARFGILESAEDPVLPVTLRHVEANLLADLARATDTRDVGVVARLQRALDDWRGRTQQLPPTEIDAILPWLRRLASTPRSQSIFTGTTLPAPLPPQSLTLPRTTESSQTEVLGIPLDRGPGLYLVEIESPALGAALLGKPEPMFVPTATLVTDLGVHLRRGTSGALVWVTHLSDASPAAGVEVRIVDCHGTSLWTGTTDTEGRAFAAGLPRSGDEPRCEFETNNPEFWSDDYRALHGLAGGLLVVARTAEDLSFVHTSWSDGIEPWRFQLPYSYGEPNPLQVHTILDRSLLRAGETLHMKHIVRQTTLAGFTIPDPDEHTLAARIVHQASMEEVPLPLSFDEKGVGTGEWEIPKQARLGNYAIRIGDTPYGPTSAEFRVEEFRLPSMTANVSFPEANQVQPQQVDVDLGVHYLAGGPAVELPVTLRTQVRERSFQPGAPFEGFTFANGPVQTGIERSGRSGAEEPVAEVRRVDLKLDAHGVARSAVDNLPSVTRPSELVAELAFRDANGSEQNVARTLPLWPARHLVAITAEDWVATPQDLRLRTAVVDTQGRPVADARVTVEVFQRRSYSHRKRVVGGFYAYEHTTETSGPVATFCSGTTHVSGLFACSGATELSGNLVLQASVTDPDGRTSHAQTEVWVVSDEHWWFDVSDSDRMDLIPERFAYEPGETARIQVRSPFQEATGLVTVERDGILESFVTHLSGTNPVISVPLQRAYAPNVFVSVFAVRGRIGNVAPTAMLDLGKPAFRLGITELQVGWREHRLEVKVTPEQDTYRTRDTAFVDVEVRNADGTPLPPGTELVVAAIDESLLELAANPSWDLLTGMMQRRSHGIFTATAQGHVVGKRHFGRKALPTGGGGGMQTTRELFDTLLTWIPRLPVNESGKARFAVPLNDALTAFRIVAVAVGGADRFGHGTATIRSTQDIQLTAGVPPFVRQGDRFQAEVTVRNATQAARTLQVGGSIQETQTTLPLQQVELAPGAAQTLRWEVVAPAQFDRLTYDFLAGPEGADDRLRVSQSLVPPLRPSTLQSSLHTLDRPVRESLATPADALAGSGSLHIGFAAGFDAALRGVRRHMLEYPFTCLEQEVSRAVALDDRELWRALSSTLPTYRSAGGLLSFFPRLQRGSVELTAYVVAMAHATGWSLGDSELESALAALARFVDGGLDASFETSTNNLPLLKLIALEALSRHERVDAAQLDSITFEPELWPTQSVLDAWSIYTRQPSLPAAEERRATCERILKSRLRAQSTTLDFGANSQGGGMLTCDDAAATRLALHLAEFSLWGDDLTRTVRGAVARRDRGHWDCTTSNAWGALALRRWSERHGGTVAGTTQVRLAANQQSTSWSENKPSPEHIELAWPDGASQLELQHDGSGAPQAIVELRAAIPLRAPLTAGYAVSKSVVPLQRRDPSRHSVGDIWKIELTIEAQSDAAWVVIDDPLPAGASHIGTGLARDSQLAPGASGTAAEPWSEPTFIERRQQSYRAYFERLPEGKLQLEYRVRLDQDGTFQVPPTRVEAMYEPDRFGMLPNPEVTVAR